MVTCLRHNTYGFTKEWLEDNRPWVVMHNGSRLDNVMEIDPETMTMRLASKPIRVDRATCEIVSTTHRLHKLDIEGSTNTIHVHLDHETTRSTLLTTFALILWSTTMVSITDFRISLPLLVSSLCMSYACYLLQKRIEENSYGIDCTPPAVHLSRELR